LLALKNRVCPEFTVLNVFFILQNFDQHALALKLFSVLKYFLSYRIFENFEQPALALKTEFALTFSSRGSRSSRPTASYASVSVHRHAHRFASASITILPQICTVWCTKLLKHFNAIMEVFYCFTVAIGLPGDASDDKRSAVAARMQNKVVVE